MPGTCKLNFSEEQMSYAQHPEKHQSYRYYKSHNERLAVGN